MYPPPNRIIRSLQKTALVICKMAASILERFYMIDDGFFTFNLKYLFFVGLWPEKYQKFLYKIYEIFLHFLTIVFLVITGIGTYQHKDDITIVLCNIDKCLVIYNFFFKTIIFCIKRDQLRDLIDEIERSGDGVTEEKKKLMAKYVVFLTLISAAVICAFSLVALFEGKMSIETWMPFDPTVNMMSLITSLQILAIIIFPALCRAFAMQGLVCSMLMYLCDQLIHLQSDLRGLKYSKESDTSTRMKFRKIIKKHIRLMG